MLFELFLSLRYLKAKRKQAFISVISVISVLGVMVGVMALVVVLSVMNGFRSELISKSLGITSHIQIESYEGSIADYDGLMKELKTVEGVVETSPLVYKDAIFSAGYTSLIRLAGVDTGSITKVINVADMMKQGDLHSLDNANDDFPGIIIGKELANSLRIGTGDTLKVYTLDGRLTPLVRTPKKQTFRITGIYSSGSIDFDLRLAFVSLSAAQKLLNIEGKATRIDIKVDDAEKSDVIGNAIREKLGRSYWVQDWTAQYRGLLEALQLEKYAQFVILVMIVMVGALNIISVLVMTVIEKSKDIAILRTMGATKKSIMIVFMIQGMVIGVVGTIAGTCAGLGICFLLENYIFIELPSDIYPFSNLPVLVEWVDVLLIAVSGLLLSFLTTIYPSWNASRLNPVETLRYE